MVTQPSGAFLQAHRTQSEEGFENGISLDQFAAEHIGSQTRFPSLVLAITNENTTVSYTRSGAPIPADKSPRLLFEKLFVQGRPDEIEARVEELRRGRSTLDFVADQSKRLSRNLSNVDQQRLAEYQSSVRELERRLHSAQEWEHRPKPKVDAKPPAENMDPKQFVERSGMMFDVMKLALETDSTRIVSLMIDTTVIHNITHHGNRPEVLEELKGHEQRQFDALNRFLTGLRSTGEQGSSLLDRTMVLYGTCMGSANSHSNDNLPVMLAGEVFSMASILRSTLRITTRFRICTCRCCSEWELMPIHSRREKEPCVGWNFPNHEVPQLPSFRPR